MEDKALDAYEEEPQFTSNKEEVVSLEVTEPNFKENALASIYKQKHSAETWFKESFLQRQCYIDLTILKYSCFISLDEKYLRCYLEFVEFRASNFLSIVGTNFVVKPRSSKMEVLYESFGPRKQGGKTSDLDSFFLLCPSPSPTETGQWTVDYSGGNTNLRNEKKYPLLLQFGGLDNDANLGSVGSLDLEEAKFGDLKESNSSRLESQRHEPESSHRRLISTSSTGSSFSVSASGSHGMLHCLWKNGIPYFTFSVDNLKEVFVANLFKIESSDYKNLDYIYLFHSKTGGQKENGFCNDVSDLVGKMKVSSSLTVCSDNSKLMETEFVLIGADVKHFEEVRAPGTHFWKKRGSSKRIIDMFKTKHRSDAKFGGSSSITEDVSLEPCQDMPNKIGGLDRTVLMETTPNLELAAIIMKNRLRSNSQIAQFGGWGLKFLDKGTVECANTPLEDSNCSYSDCSTSMNVLVPAGFHGGQRAKTGGPSGLTERWRSGGHCDCGGWDIGCPLTILNSGSSKEFCFKLMGPANHLI
ncbi:hypothetical protein GIB67_024680 [Kingdonia uniflora]|uniref:Uncharacterized protein n=1 Tax=Kingdonia uniflora TaxID=39325 RepID=A0A7J7LPA0_9MAGN|nr:hypothetical protein GIB67_024680 [Kingdonia uniflora]